MGPHNPSRTYPLWLRLIMPSITDVIFLLLFVFLIQSENQILLRDADTGWRIRNGEVILKTHAVPAKDYFSFTMAGKPWFAWGWLFDVLVAVAHKLSGLRGVVIFSALVIALTYTLLFKLIFKYSNHLILSIVLFLVSTFASMIHFLARPHILSLLFTLIWYYILDRFQKQNHRIGSLFLLPIIMIVWVNSHGGFLVGLVLAAIYLIGNVLAPLTHTDEGDKEKAKTLSNRLAVVILICLLVTLINPYGYKLHLHIYEHLSNKFLMDHIGEFLSPNFHALGEKFFEAMLMLTFIVFSVSIRRWTIIEMILLISWTHAAFQSVRNIPFFTIIVAPILGIHLNNFLSSVPSAQNVIFPARRLVNSVTAFSVRMGNLQRQFNFHIIPAVVLVFVLAGFSNCERPAAAKLRRIDFDPSKLPVHAAEFISAQQLQGNLFASDQWGSYLIYRFYPRLRVFIDDRNDLYGEKFVHEYLRLANAEWDWKEILAKYNIDWVLVSTDSPLGSTLKENRQWKLVYDDGVALIFTKS